MRILKATLALASAAFLVRYGYSAWHSTLTQDDFCQLGGILEKGYWGGQWLWWQTWQGRWASVLINTAYAGLARDSGFIAAFGFSTLLLILATFALIFRPWSSSFREAVLLSVFVSFLWYSATLNVGESWYWIAACTSYVWPVASALLGVLLLQSTLPALKKNALSFLLFAFTTGCSEAVGAITLSLLLLVTILQRVKFQKYSSEWLWAMGGSALSFSFMALSPGNKIRLEQTGFELHLISALIKSIPDSLVILGVLIHFKKIWLAGALVFGAVTPKLTSIPRPSLKQLGFIGALVLVLSTALILPSEVTAGGPPADRSWVLQSALLVIFCGAVGMWASQWNLAQRIAPALLCVLSLIATGYQISLFLRDRKGIDAYVAGYQIRMEHLKDLRDDEQNTPVQLPPLPFTNFYHTAEIGAEHGWVNVCLERGMKLPFRVTREP